jgi:hypothetical protein
MVHARARIPDRARLGNSLADGPERRPCFFLRAVAGGGSIGCMFLSFASGRRPQQRVSLRTSSRSCCGINSSCSNDTSGAPRCAPPIAPSLPRCAGPAAATPTRLDRDATNASALASGTRPSHVDAAAAGRGPPARRWSGARARAALRTREPGLGLPAHRRGVAEARSEPSVDPGHSRAPARQVVRRRRGLPPRRPRPCRRAARAAARARARE